jgi:DNA-binding CsgD family transcriptional regulator
VDRSPLLERQLEVSTLTTFLTDPAGPGLLLIEGPAGIGKTRLMAAVRGLAAGNGALVLSARGSELERGFAFGVLRQLFEPFLLRLGAVKRAQLLGGAAATAAPLFGARYWDTQYWEPRDEPGDGVEDGSFALLHGLYWLAVNLSAEQPLVLAVDDLHWVDVPSLRWLAYSLPRLDGVPIRVVTAARSGSRGTDESLLRRIVTDPVTAPVRPAPLSPAATETLLRSALGDAAEAPFIAGCHMLTGGNPLYLRELAAALSAEGVAPVAASLDRVQALAGRAASRTVATRMAILPEAAVRVARAAAILGDRAELAHIAALTHLTTDETATAIGLLVQSDILQRGLPATFAHPMIKAAIESEISPAERTALHGAAAGLLAAVYAEPERIAAHLMYTDPGRPATVSTLREAARRARTRGAPASALDYLDRCRREPMEQTTRVEVLVQAGDAARRVDLAAALDRLGASAMLTDDPYRRGYIDWLLASTLLMAGRSQEIVDLCGETLSRLPDDAQDLRLRMQAMRSLVPVFEPGRLDLLDELAELRRLPPVSGHGGRSIDSVVARHDAMAGNPAAVDRARRALAGTIETDGTASLCWHVLVAAEANEAVDVLTSALAHIHRTGDITELVPAYTLRALAWLGRGQLAEAESDLREAEHAEQIANVGLGRPFIGAYLAQGLIEQGRLEEAAGVLASSAPDPVPAKGPMYHLMEARAQLLGVRGHHEQAVAAATLCGQRFAAHGGQNPAFVAWRGRAAVSLQALGRVDQAIALIEEELDLARRWSAPGPIGRALRLAGLFTGGVHGRHLLEEAVAVLEPSGARLEHAKALADLGAVLRRTGHRASAREPLRRGLELATICGAEPLARHVRTELLATGARPRRSTPTGPQALTPSERRVAQMAAAHATNREIAQALFVTPKTVEVHLSSVYRKLGISSRNELAGALGTAEHAAVAAGGRPSPAGG